MPSDATFELFEKELNRLVESFGKRLAELKQPGYAEAQLRDDFLNPFFRALGWDMENRAGLIQKEREVEIESATQIGGGRKRADYFFRTDKRDRFVCEAKKPAEELSARYAFQTKRYAWNKPVPLGVLTDFEEMKIYVVGSRPYLDEPHVGEWKHWNFRQYPLVARELWDLLARDKVAAGSIDQAIEALPKRPAGKGKARQQWLIKPDRTRALDVEFLKFLDESRRDLASDIYKNNDHGELAEDNRLTEFCQRIIDRILFLRICEDRDIDTGTTLQSIVETWRKNSDLVGDDVRSLKLEKEGKSQRLVTSSPASLWRRVVDHFRALDRRPPTHVPFFNGNLFKPHDSEKLIVGDEWLAGFIGELSADESPYLFSEIPVEILGSVYERFLGNVVRPHGKGITVEPKPEVRKAGGVYYTPRYIVDYIVEQTAGKLLDAIAGGAPVSDPARTEVNTSAPDRRSALRDFEQRTAALRLLDPACGSGSFLIRAFERVCEHWQKRLTADLRSSRRESAQTNPATEDSQSRLTSAATRDWQKKHRALCWVDDRTGDVHLTVELKRKILTQNIYGVDLDAAAVEVTQLSLYLKMLENENRTTLQRQRELLADEADIALLPPLQDNIKCGNSLIASDFSMMSEDLVRVHAFDWPVQFAPIMKAGGFDAVIGNPPYLAGREWTESLWEQRPYFLSNYSCMTDQYDLYALFIQKAVLLTKKAGMWGFITPNTWLNNEHYTDLREWLVEKTEIRQIGDYRDVSVFDGATVLPIIIIASPKDKPDGNTVCRIEKFSSPNQSTQMETSVSVWRQFPGLVFNVSLSHRELPVLKKIELKAKPLGDSCDARFGVKVYQRGKGKPPQSGKEAEQKLYEADSKRGRDYHLYLWGEHVTRWHISHGQTWLKYGPHLAEPRTIELFEGPRVLVRRIVGERLVICPTAETLIADQLLHTVKPRTSNLDYRFLAAVLGSSSVAYYFRKRFNRTEKTFPEIRVAELSALPIPVLDLKKPADKSRHDKLVMLVDKLLGLMPKLRAATAESEKAVLQNAVTATDQQIDALVYELYGLTEEEIKLVEGGQ
ncbi:MAG: Eco57I restriction-modification methylase domain-containing protein [Verrucomicrobiales bacterium]|nr:Eco57I restriction-modification methylase domain-containing protein [Verrucomicrobiales bacterium]